MGVWPSSDKRAPAVCVAAREEKHGGSLTSPFTGPHGVIVSGPSDAEVVVSCDDLSAPNVAPEVMQGPLSRPVGALHAESVELFGRSEDFVSGLDPPLFLRDQLHSSIPTRVSGAASNELNSEGCSA